MASPVQQLVRYREEPQAEPSPRVTLLRTRMADDYAHHYNLIVSIFKGLALAAAAFALVSILTQGAEARVNLTALAFWIATFVSVVANYDGIMVATILITTPPNTVDVLMPFLTGVSEFLAFAVLNLQFQASTPTASSPAAQLLQFSWWPLVFTLYSATSLATIWGARNALAAEERRARADERELIRWYQSQLRQAQVFIAVNAAAMLLFFVALRYGFASVWGLHWVPRPAELRRWEGVVGILMVPGLLMALAGQQRARRFFADAIDPAEAR